MRWTTIAQQRFGDGTVTVDASEYEGYSVRRCITKTKRGGSTQYYVHTGDHTPTALRVPFKDDTSLRRAIDKHLSTRSSAA